MRANTSDLGKLTTFLEATEVCQCVSKQPTLLACHRAGHPTLEGNDSRGEPGTPESGDSLTELFFYFLIPSSLLMLTVFYSGIVNIH